MKTHYLQSVMKGLVSVAVAVALPIIVISMVFASKKTANNEKQDAIEK